MGGRLGLILCRICTHPTGALQPFHQGGVVVAHRIELAVLGHWDQGISLVGPPVHQRIGARVSAHPIGIRFGRAGFAELLRVGLNPALRVGIIALVGRVLGHGRVDVGLGVIGEKLARMRNASVRQGHVVPHHGAGDVRLLEQLRTVHVAIPLIAVGTDPLLLPRRSLGLVDVDQTGEHGLALLLGQGLAGLEPIGGRRGGFRFRRLVEQAGTLRLGARLAPARHVLLVVVDRRASEHIAGGVGAGVNGLCLQLEALGLPVDLRLVVQGLRIGGPVLLRQYVGARRCGQAGFLACWI